ncbi:MAG: ROK family protein [Lentilitoribacter sp.]
MSKTKQVYLSDDVRKQNRLRIISQFRLYGKKSRTEISKLADLSAGTVTNVSTMLLDDGIITVCEPDITTQTSNSHGRPRVQLELNPGYRFVVAGSLTFNSISLSVVDYVGDKIATVQEKVSLDNLNGHDVAQAILSMLNSLEMKITPSIFVLGVQGLTNNSGKEILWSPILSESGLKFADHLSQLANAEVIVANDSAMIAKSLSKDKEYKDGTFAAVLMSYGIGLGLYMDGEPFHGAKSSASELGHISYKGNDGALCRCKKHGCVEAYASDYAIWRRANQLDPNTLPDRQITSDDIANIIEEAKNSEGAAREAIREAGRAMGFGLAIMFGLFDAFPVVFVGRGAQALDLMQDEIRKSLNEHFRFHKQLDVSFTQANDALIHVENGSSIIGLEWLDQQAAFGKS